MMYSRDARNMSIDEFLDLGKLRLKQFVKFARTVTNSLGEKPNAERGYYELNLGDFNFKWHPCACAPKYLNYSYLEIFYKGTQVLTYTYPEENLRKHRNSFDEWEDKLEELMKTPDMQKYLVRRL